MAEEIYKLRILSHHKTYNGRRYFANDPNNNTFECHQPWHLTRPDQFELVEDTSENEPVNKPFEQPESISEEEFESLLDE